MKLKENLVLRKVAGGWMVLPLADSTVNLNKLLSINESGALLWNLLAQGSDREALADTLVKAYEVSKETALADVDEFLNKLNTAGYLDM